MRHSIKQSLRSANFKWFALGSTLLCYSLAARPMDLLQAYQAAQSNDASILASRATAVAERERLPQAMSQLYPSLSASLSHTKNNLSSTSPNILGVEQTTDSNYPSNNKTLTLRQPLFRKQLMAQYRQAEAQVGDAEATLVVAVRVSGAYFEAMLTHDQLALVLVQQKAYTEQLDAARKTYAAGSGTRTDVDEAQARLDMNLAQEIEARQNVAYTLQQLQTLVNQPIDKLARLKVASLELSFPQPNRLEEWVARAELSNPQLQSLKARVEIARQETEKARSGHYPTLDAIVQWTDSSSESVSNTRQRYLNKSLGMQLSVPLFAGGYVNSQVRQTLASQERAEQLLEAGRRDLGLRVAKEFRGITENIPKIKALEQALRSADQLVLSSQRSFQAGNRTVLDISNAEQQRMTVQRDLAQARYMYLISRIGLLALVGGADLDAVVALNRALEN
jgi:outer membrane protein, protease secretion system